MRTIKELSVKGLLLLFLFTVSLAGFSQTLKEAIDAYNEGASLMKSDPEGAIKAFEKCVSISEQLGEEGAETRDKAADQLPTMYYTVAMNTYKTKDYSGAIKGFEKAAEVGDQYGNSQISSKANQIIPQLYNIEGSAFYKEENYDAALNSFDQAIKKMPNYAKPYLGKALVYKNQEAYEDMLAACDKAIEVGMSTGDDNTTESAEKLARNTMFNNAVMALEAKNWGEAEDGLKKSIMYGNSSPDTYFQLGRVYNAQEKWNDAITNLNRGIELDDGGTDTRARYYYEMGNAYVGLGDTAAACDAFKNAMYGQYAENAKYQVETVLKCN